MEGNVSDAIVANLNYQAYTILIVDDNPTNLGVITDYLEGFGFTIITARNGESGLRRAKMAHPDLILLDVMMPDIDGFETCRRLKADETMREIPVIFMTALTSTEDKVKGFEVGAVDYITKPIQHEEVLARVTTHLRLRDLARSLQAQYELEKKMRQLEETRAQELTELNASKDKFFSIVAHDLKGPFMPLIGNLELLTEMTDTLTHEQIKDMGQSMLNSSKNVYNLLENLLSWSRMQMGRMDYCPSMVELRQIVNQNVELLSPNALAKRVELRSQIVPKILVYADENMLDTVVRNLINNALKFTPANGQVTVNVAVGQQELPACVEVTVKDTGVGVKPEDLAKLFKIEVHHTTIGTAKENGTGLGLLICKEMVEKNGGQIWMESEFGHGTSVKFTVPLDKTMSELTASLTNSSTELTNIEVAFPIETIATNWPVPPREEIEAMYTLIIQGDIIGVGERARELKQVNTQYTEFANKLIELVKWFEDEEVTALLERYR